jgi:P pilus assembly chaperone PapD
MSQKTILTILATLGIFLPLAMAQAAGIQVAPARLDFQIKSEKAAALNLTIVNPTADVQLFEVYTDDFPELIKANPASFTLEAGAKKIVSISIDAGKQKANQSLSTTLSVVGKPLADKQLSVSTGVKIPLTITFSQSVPNPQTHNLIFFGLAVLVLVGLAYYFKAIKKPPEDQRRHQGE